jgi:hypothetical protein
MSDVLVERIAEELDASIDRGRVRYIGGDPLRLAPGRVAVTRGRST